MSTELRGLYAITPETTAADTLLASVAAVLAGGCRMLQFRDKHSPMAERVARARALRALTRTHGARLIVNDDLALATLVDADGLHLGAADGNLHAARAVLGRDRILGASCYADFAAAKAAVAAGVDYVAFGAVYPSPTKPEAVYAPPALFERARRELPVRCCAIGGITPDKAPAVLAAGADLLAVITDLFTAPDIAACAAQYQRLFEEPAA
ncbi:MAG: thiamine phosphate synthase [Azonexus sp.]|jgi:thiamine-phosphate pyrophosphorylase|uniref:thiamine phosphate synthase n=1 Tax=Azonexus sp. TaxID=1872668 RepID=UPI002835AA28|nr:thiamine phosphate synthase [Azonexus sp.]MDR0776395.1 thiamine phosphate synthase [Azonexus sp.]